MGNIFSKKIRTTVRLQRQGSDEDIVASVKLLPDTTGGELKELLRTLEKEDWETWSSDTPVQIATVTTKQGKPLCILLDDHAIVQDLPGFFPNISILELVSGPARSPQLIVGVLYNSKSSLVTPTPNFSPFAAVSLLTHTRCFTAH